MCLVEFKKKNTGSDRTLKETNCKMAFWVRRKRMSQCSRDPRLYAS